MIGLALRYNILIWLLILLLLGLSIRLGSVLPAIGTITFELLENGDIKKYYVDVEMGIITYQSIVPDNVVKEQLIVRGNPSSEQTIIRSIGNEETLITTYDGMTLYKDSVSWLVHDKTIVVLGTQARPAKATVFFVDAATGDWTEFVTIDSLETGIFSFSPDMRYILLRQNSEGTIANPIRNGQALYLINLETGQIKDLGRTNFAYWSPTSQAIVIGYPSNFIYFSRLSIYDLIQDRMQDFELIVSQVDTRTANGGSSENVVLWRNDGQALVVSNPERAELYYIGLDGQIVVSSVGRILPRLWSPDGNYVLGYGNDLEGNTGAFIIRPISGGYHFLKTPVLLLGSYTIEAWSPDSHYIALYPYRRDMDSLSIFVFNVSGEMVSAPLEAASADEGFLVYGSLRWME